MSTASTPELTYTIEDFISFQGDVLITYDTLSISETLASGDKMISYNVLNDYIDELNNMAVTVQLTDDEYSRYLYKPKLLCYDTYGVGELYFIILYLNDICDVKDFNFKKIKMFKKDAINIVLSAIYNAEKANIAKYS